MIRRDSSKSGWSERVIRDRDPKDDSKSQCNGCPEAAKMTAKDSQERRLDIGLVVFADLHIIHTPVRFDCTV